MLDLSVRTSVSALAYELRSPYATASFYDEMLPLAARYDRAVAFLSSSVLELTHQHFERFLENGGHVRLICSPSLSRDDVDALRLAVWSRGQAREYRFDELAHRCRSGAEHWSRLFAWLIAHDHVSLRIALIEGSQNDRIYHEKIGVFGGTDGHIVAFSGSANESKTALARNFERFDIFPSWRSDPDRIRARMIEQDFLALWHNRTPGVQVIDLFNALRRDLLVSPPESMEFDQPIKEWSHQERQMELHEPPAEVIQPPADITLYEHQREALRCWGRAGGRGILEMATGSGKTITALSLASGLYDGIGPGLAIVIVAPFIHLVDQWRSVAKLFGLDPIRCAESRGLWSDELASAIHALNSGQRPVLSLTTTTATLMTPHLRKQLARIRKPILIIGDEAHNYGATSTLSALPENARYRLGLSATPDRWMDDTGTARLKDYFGDVVFQYTLGDAIRDSVLTPYLYFPQIVSLEDDELEQYAELTRLLARYMSPDGGVVSDQAKFLLLKRARLIGTAKQKMPLLKTLLAKRRDDSHILVYCGDGQVDDPDDPEESIRQIEEVVRIVGVELGMRCASYTASTPPVRRKQLIEAFSRGDVQVLVAIRCLDEGVDIPATRVAYILASSTNPRQFIQRRGRVLRRSPGKNRAEVYDFFVAPPLDNIDPDSPEYRVSKGLIRSQIRRAREFADLAENGPIARKPLLELSERIGVLDEWGS